MEAENSSTAGVASVYCNYLACDCPFYTVGQEHHACIDPSRKKFRELFADCCMLTIFRLFIQTNESSPRL